MISNVEENLKIWCKTKDEVLFTNHLYEYFNIVAAHICQKYSIKSCDIAETISDLVSEAWLQLPEKYNPDKSIKGMLFIIMSQYLNKKLNSEKCQKRDKRLLVYIEDMEGELPGATTNLIEITIHNIDELKEALLQYKPLFKSLDKTKQAKIRDVIIDCIETPEKYECAYNSYVKDIAKKSKSSASEVYYTLEKMNGIISGIE